jgi:rod shape-determining protein MreD
MAEHSYTSRAELDQHSFHSAVTLLVPLVCVVLQATLPKVWHPFGVLDLPLLVVIYFSIARRSQIKGTITGSLIGLFQDGLTNHYFGIFGIAKAVIGYLAASIGFAVDVENVVNRVALTFGFSLVQTGLVYMISRWLLGESTFLLMPLHGLIGAVCNAAVSVPLFFLLDRFRMRE